MFTPRNNCLPRRGPVIAALLGLVCGLGVWAFALPGTAAAALPSACRQAAYNVTCSFFYTGSEQTFTVPRGVGVVKIHAVGGAGGAGQSAPGGQPAPGGLAGLVDAPVSVTSGETLYVEVGGDGQPSGAGGWNGGGNGGPTDGGGGGGASDVRTVSCGGDCTGAASQASRLIVAGGGGGGGGFSGGAGGDAGSDGSFDGIDLAVTGGGAGTLAAGGGGGQEPIADDSPGQPGQAGYGGVGGTNDPQVYDIGQGGGGVGYAPGTYPGGGGGGGGGYYGGGGGGGGGAGGGGPTIGGGGGGGGSSYATGEVADGVSSGTLPAVVEISYTLQHAFTSTQAVSFSTQPQATLSASESVTLTNIGGAPLHVTGLLFSGADAGDFLVTSDDCRGNYLSPGLTEPANDSCVINVAFAPQAQGSRTGSLVIESDDPLGPTTVPLSGTGGPLPQGPAGSPGANGATGPQGPIGPQGPSATVVCQNTAVARAICSITFAPGTWSLQRSTKTASFRISRSSRIVAQGKVKISHGRLILRPISQLSRGTYHLAILVGHGRGWKIAMRRTFTVN